MFPKNVYLCKMKPSDGFFVLGAVLICLPFFLFPSLYAGYEALNTAHPFLLAFGKFALLATAGEALGWRIRQGSYPPQSFGLLPRAVVWGILGVGIAAAMKLYAFGAPRLMEVVGFDGSVVAMGAGFSWLKLANAFAISLCMNLTFAPIFMTCHKITDTHIMAQGGSMKALWRPLPFGRYLAGINWEVQWGFVFKKTIPLFWIPAHTLTFMLPPQWQVLFAAFLGLALGVLLAVAARK